MAERITGITDKDIKTHLNAENVVFSNLGGVERALVIPKNSDLKSFYELLENDALYHPTLGGIRRNKYLKGGVTDFTRFTSQYIAREQAMKILYDYLTKTTDTTNDTSTQGPPGHIDGLLQDSN